MHARLYAAGALICLLVLAFAHSASASDRCDIMFVNNLGERIHAISILFDTPYGEDRDTSSTVTLPPGGTYRIGVQGVTLPKRITLTLSLGACTFTDLTGLSPSASMLLSVEDGNGVPLLKRTDDEREGEASGLKRLFLTPQNRPNAVDRDYLSDATSLDAVRELVGDAVKEALEELGERNNITLKAGPVSSYAQARQRCPELVEEWNAANSGQARWTGEWLETDPGKESECSAATGTDTLENTLFSEETGRGEVLSFPLFWQDWFGYATAQWYNASDPQEGIALIVTIPLPENDVPGMLDELLSDLRVDGYRPAGFSLEEAGAEDKEINFLEGDGDKFDDQDAIQELLNAALEKGAFKEANLRWVQVEAFDKKRAGEEPEPGPGVGILIKDGLFKAIFVPDSGMLL